jgi:hypothetical protein
MPLERHTGRSISDLETAIANIERSNARIIQVVGQHDDAWWVLTEQRASVLETRGGAA